MGTVVTGIGVVSAAGLNVDENLKSLRCCRSGVAKARFLQTRHDVPLGEVALSNDELRSLLGVPEKERFSRASLLGLLAAREALKDSGLRVDSGTRVGLVSATSAGGMDRSEFFYKDEVSKRNSGRLRDVVLHDCGDSSETVARSLGISDFVTTISTACSSSANAIILADRLLRHNRLDAVLVGGIDPLCKFTVNGFSSLMILDKDLCRPFDRSRAGLNLGEGAAFLVLQRKEDVKSGGYCRLSGFANANDAFHQTAISHDGIGPFLAMEGALKRAGLHPSDIDYVNVHGTGTENNDWSEGVAMKRLFGDCVPMFSSTKVYTGHTLGACGAIEAVYSVLSLVNDMAFPTFNFKNAIEGLDIEPVTALRENVGLKNVMSNSFGFGGNVSSLIFSKM